MRNAFLAILLFCSCQPDAWAQPAEAFAQVYNRLAGQQPALGLNEDACWRYATPVFTVDIGARTVRAVQRVTPGECPAPAIRDARYPIPGTFPVGRYRMEYVQDAVGYTPPLPSVFSFWIRPEEHGTLLFDPPDPVALEPIRVGVFTDVSCTSLDRVLPVNGGFRVVTRSRVGPDCDLPSVGYLTMGAFAPGTYQVEAGFFDNGGSGAWVAAQQGTLVVRSAPVQGVIPLPDLSGVWFSPRGAPSTGLTLFHARSGAGASTGRFETITAIWYLYDSSGAPLWYVIVAEPEPSGSLSGPVLAFNTGGGQPASTVVGNARIDFDFPTSTGRLRATVGERSFDLEIERFRWVRRAWP